ncbi:hypothetical protein DNH61_06945 [Paenibacillus sambharensis]|uniref:Uncharacterized protein n=1 Tax=Paenibacillus sambharensis TaxID=1803190 RepID=A0A2W1LNS7_9BACL|nr:hypothetical protein [Paenibacillus sambharensis]PZD96535.1 hypothetical protein DNH61_06945 [Paenibacillus sambharensis]
MPHRKFLSADIRPRYPKGQISVFGVNSVYPRIPWVCALWSLCFPGFGHMFVGKYLHGFILIVWELVVNNMSNLNLSIALSFQGRYMEAASVINQDWALLYIAVYVYCVWDSYRCAVEIKKSHILSEVEDAPIAPSAVNFFDIVILDKKNPWVGMIWSVFSPGLGQLYGGSTVVGTFILAWWITICYKAVAVRSLLHSFLGNFHLVHEIVDWQWFLFLPSMYGFAVYQAYVSVTENNTLFDIEQIRFLRVRAENLGHRNEADNGTKQILATFDHSPFVEIVIHEIELLGVPPCNVVALPVENLDSKTHILDSIHRVDGRSILDGAMVSATLLAVLGAIYGFVMYWGPIIWGLIGLGGGFILGLGIELALKHRSKVKLISKRKAEVIMQITCPSPLYDQLIAILKSRNAAGFVVMPQEASAR